MFEISFDYYALFVRKIVNFIIMAGTFANILRIAITQARNDYIISM